MKLIWILSFLLLISVDAADSQVYATFSGDTTEIWDANYEWNCILKSNPMFPIVTRSQDTLYITECDTTPGRVLCDCKFDFCTSLTGLAIGTYVATVTREYHALWHVPVGNTFKDTVMYWTENAGSVTFTVFNPPSISPKVSSYQSPCLNSVGSITKSKFVPSGFAMIANYPNPFNPSTTIRYSIPVSCQVVLSVYNALGQKLSTLVNARKLAGTYEVKYNARNLPSGAYFCRLDYDGKMLSNRFIVAK